jgi:hypothetical protein
MVTYKNQRRNFIHGFGTVNNDITNHTSFL